MVSSMEEELRAAHTCKPVSSGRRVFQTGAGRRVSAVLCWHLSQMSQCLQSLPNWGILRLVRFWEPSL